VTADKVVDASALAAAVFLEPGFADVRARIHGCKLYAPALIWFEMANVCVKKMRSIPSDRDLILRQHEAGLKTAIERREVDHRQVVSLAERHKLSAYDASYLWLAKQLNCELVTLDVRLNAAAQAI